MPWPFDDVPWNVALDHTWNWIVDGATHPMQAIDAAGQNLDKFLRPIEEPINNFLNADNPVSKIASAVLANGAHIGTNGSGLGMQASPRPNDPKIAENAIKTGMNNAAAFNPGPTNVSFPTVNAPTVGPSNSVGYTPINLNSSQNMADPSGRPLKWTGSGWDWADTPTSSVGLSPVNNAPTVSNPQNVGNDTMGPPDPSQVSQTYGPLDSRFTTDAQWKEFLRAPNGDGYTTSQAQGLYNEWKANHPQVNVNSQNPMKPGYSDTAPPNQAAQNPGPPVNPNGTSKGSGSGGGDGTPPGPPAGMDPSLWALLLGTGGSAAATYFAAKAQADAATAAANAQGQATKDALKQQQDQFDKTNGINEKIYNQQRNDIMPWVNAGGRALGKVESFDATHPLFSSLKNDWKTVDDGYNFRFNEGMKALQNSAAARGGIMAGNTGKALQQYGQDMASQEYNNAFNRYQTERGGQLNALQSLAGIGQSAVQQSNTSGSQYANNAAANGQNYTNNSSALTTAGGNAAAAGIQGVGNANASGYAGYGNILSSAMSEYNKRVAGQEQNALTKSLFGKG